MVPPPPIHHPLVDDLYMVVLYRSLCAASLVNPRPSPIPMEVTLRVTSCLVLLHHVVDDLLATLSFLR